MTVRVPNVAHIVGLWLSCLLLNACGDDAEQNIGAPPPVVRVYNWSDYITDDVLALFEKETGIRVAYDVFDTNELLETKLLSGDSGYDVVVPAGHFLARQIQAGVFQALDRNRLPHWDHQWPLIMARTAVFDPGNRYALNYMWGTTGIGYNLDAVEKRIAGAPLDSWALVFEPEYAAALADCGINLVDTADEIIPATLNYLQLNPNSTEPEELAQALNLLKRIRPYIRQFDSTGYIDALADGDICLAVGWSGDIFQARERALAAENGVRIDYRIPQEGAMMWFDMLAIPADAPHPDNAYLLLDFLLRPEVIARISNAVYYANGNLASQQFLNEDVLGDSAIYPSPDITEKLYVVKSYSPQRQELLTHLWDELKRMQ